MTPVVIYHYQGDYFFCFRPTLTFVLPSSSSFSSSSCFNLLSFFMTFSCFFPLAYNFTSNFPLPDPLNHHLDHHSLVLLLLLHISFPVPLFLLHIPHFLSVLLLLVFFLFLFFTLFLIFLFFILMYSSLSFSSSSFSMFLRSFSSPCFFFQPLPVIIHLTYYFIH